MDKEIKTNPYYRQQQQQQQRAATSPAIQYTAQQSGQRFTATEPEQSRTKKQPVSAYNDIDMYTSFHSEIDPYKTVTSSAQIVAEPLQRLSVDLVRKSASRQTTDESIHKKNGNQEGLNRKAGSPNKHQATRHQEQRQTPALLTGPLINMDSQRHSVQQNGATNQMPTTGGKSGEQEPQVANLRVRRENSYDRDDNDPDDDGVWVDDDEDDDGKQHSSSDLSETSHKPEDEESSQQESNSPNGGASSANPPGVIGGPHGYELSPDDLMVYPG